MTARTGASKRKPARADEPKRDTTRRHLLACALALFQKHGVDATTMRDIARAAGLSLGAAYYYFASKEALVFAYYEDNQAAVDAIAAAATGTTRARLGTIIHGKLETIRAQRKMLAAILPRLASPADPLSAFSTQTHAIRARAIGVLAPVLRDAGLPADAVPLAAAALWLFELAIMLVFVTDTSPRQKRTHGLVDDLLDMLVPMLPFLATPMGHALCARATTSLARAGIAVS